MVEDTPLVRDMLTEILSQQGHHVCTADDGNEALLRTEYEEFDVIISDIHMPGMSGIELIGMVKAINPLTAVIVITGYPTMNKAIEAMKRGAADFITKPFSADHINHVVQKTLQEKRLASENEHLLAEINNKAVIEKLNRQLHQKVSQLTKLYTISESLHNHVENSSMFRHIVKLAGELTGSRRVSLMSFNTARTHLVVRASKGLSSEIQANTCLKVGERVAGRVVQKMKAVRVISRDSTPQNGNGSSSSQYNTHSWLSVPLFLGGEILGVLNLTDKSDGSDYTEEDEYLIMMLAEKAGIKIENNALYEGIYANLINTLKTLVSTIEAKDPYTRYHSQRVTETAHALAQHIGCSEDDCESIAFAGALHDIGKIGIQDSILLKNGRLTSDEYQVIKNHPVIGDSILEPLGLMEAERLIIRHHHERYDGAGYPDHLAGSQITLLSRIVSIADAFDAMISTRAYRHAMALEDVLRELKVNSGTQFDKDLVDALVEGIKRGTIHILPDMTNDKAVKEALY